MKIVRRSKNPTVRQMLNMASNLEEKSNKPSMVEMCAWKYTTGESNVYWIYIEDTLNDRFEDWGKTLDCYFSIMEKS